MKNLVLIPVLLLLNFLPFTGWRGCTSDALTTQQSSINQLRKITGIIKGLRPNQLVLLQSVERITIDSVRTKSGSFVLERQLTEPNIYYVLVGEPRTEIQCIWDGDLVLEGDINSLRQVTVKGSPLTDELKVAQAKFINPHRTELIKISQEARPLYSKGDTSGRYKVLTARYDSVFMDSFNQSKVYIQQHPNSFVSLQLLDWGWNKIGSEALLLSLSRDLQQHSIARRLKDKLRISETTAQAGARMPPFSLPDLNGNVLSNNDLAGKYTLIDFWGTWCSPCVALIPELSRLHTVFKSDSVQFIGFDCERKISNPGAISQFLKKRNVTWRQVPVDLNDSTAVDKQWEILTFPTFILVGPDQRILVRGDGTEGLNACIEELAKHQKR